MAKRNVSFEVTEELREFMRMRARMQEQSTSAYLRYLVKLDQSAWESVAEQQWEKWQRPVENIGVPSGT